METDQTLNQIKKDCLRLLTRREHSRKEIERKLLSKGHDPHMVAKTLTELSQQSWQDDARFAESYTRMRSQKGFGPVKIAYELRQQGIELSTIDRIVETKSDDWLQLLQQIYTKKYSSSDSMDINERAKRMRFLSQRGFSNAMINALFAYLSTHRT